MEKQTTKKSRFLSMILRHKPEKANITLDKSGWTDVSTLLNNIKMDMATLEEVVETNNKKRFEFNEDKSKIRARQGHSINVDLGYEPVEPPEVLFHGTAKQYLDSIMKDGLKPMGRHHVHLSATTDTAMTVGQRHGKLVMLKIAAKQMVDKLNAKFYLTDNNVWLTDSVQPQFIQIINLGKVNE